MNSLTFKEGDLVERLEGTCFRVGYEVFLCPRNRLSALGKKLVFFCVFVSNPFHPLSNLALLLDVGAYEVYNSTSGAKKMIPMHYGTFDLSDEPASEPVRLLEQFKKEDRINGDLRILKVGEQFSLHHS
jgi:hypothetical protein